MMVVPTSNSKIFLNKKDHHRQIFVCRQQQCMPQRNGRVVISIACFLIAGLLLAGKQNATVQQAFQSQLELLKKGNYDELLHQQVLTLSLIHADPPSKETVSVAPTHKNASFHSTNSTNSTDDDHFDEQNNKSSRLSTHYQYQAYDLENRNDCVLTVLVLDPRIAVFPADGLFYTSTMESVAEYTPSGTCILLQTSSCRLREYLQRGVALSAVNFIDDMTKSKSGGTTNGAGYVPSLLNATASSHDYDDTVTPNVVIQSMTRNIYTRAGPFFRAMIEKGRVRVSILHHEVYGLQACDNFYNPKQLFMSAPFWINEFRPNEDSDLILNVERDVFLCKPLNLTTQRWSQFAFVGAPWRPRLGGGLAQLKAFARHDLERTYPPHNPSYQSRLWKQYWHDQDQYYQGHTMISTATNNGSSCETMHDRVNNVLCPLPTFPPNLTWPGKYPFRPAEYKVGNGGFSLRSRKWMIRAIRSCPDLELSGLFGANGTRTTSAYHDLNTTCTSTRLFDDVYFSLLIRVIGGNTASAQQAVHFSGGMVWANDVLRLRNNRNDTYGVSSVSGDAGLKAYWNEMETIGRFIPIGYHKCHYQMYECPERRHCKYSFNIGEQEALAVA